MTPSPPTPKQRAAALSRAARTRKKRSEVKGQLRHGDASLTDVLEEGQADSAIGGMTVLDLLASLPGMDKARAKGILGGLDIAGTRHLRSLSPTEQAVLSRAFAEHDSSGQTLRLPQSFNSPDPAGGSTDDPNSLGELGPRPGTGHHVEPDDGADVVEPTERAGESTAGRPDRGTQAAGASQVSSDQAVHASDSASSLVQASPWWKKWGGKLGAAAAAVIVAALGAWLGVWFVFFAGPPASAPSGSPIGNPGQAPGRQDVSTLSPKHRFYAVANFFYFQSCGRPC